MTFTNSLRKSSQRDNIEYDTPEELAIDVINLVQFENGDRVLDPCYGNGVFLNNFPDNVVKIGCEIKDGKDFFQFNEQVDWIIGNPPFGKLLNHWFEHSFSIANKGVVYILPSYALSDKRMKYIKEHCFYIANIQTFRCWFGYPVLVVTFLRGVNPNKTLSKFYYKSPYEKSHNGKI